MSRVRNPERVPSGVPPQAVRLAVGQLDTALDGQRSDLIDVEAAQGEAAAALLVAGQPVPVLTWRRSAGDDHDRPVPVETLDCTHHGQG